MRLHVHRSAEAFLDALKSDDGAYYATFDRSSTRSEVLRETEAVARDEGHRNLAANPELRAVAEDLLRDYFDAAARTDPDAAFTYSSRVLLAVPDYPDLALLFLLKAVRTLDPAATVHALVSDDWKAGLVKFEGEGGEPPRFPARGLRGTARALRSFGRGLLNRRPRSRCDVLLFTLGDALADGGTDAYFGDLAQALARRCAVKTVYAAPGARVRLRSSDTVAPLEAFLRPLDALRALLAPGAESGEDALSRYLEAREHAAGDDVMLRVMSRAFDRMVARLRPHTIVYPFENRSWEKHLLRAARRHGVRRCVGYQHSSLTPRHLAFSSAAGLAGHADLPDAIVTCGEVTAERVRADIPQARSLVTVGAALRARRIDVPPPTGWGVLAAISSSRAEAWEILGVLHELTAESQVPVIVRSHPTIPIDDLYAQFEWPAHVVLSRGRTLAEDFAASGLVAYSSSTVALEGMLYGRLPVYLDIGDVPSGDPLGGEHSFVTRARSGRELARAIARLESLPAGELADLRDAARAYAESYLVEPTPENVRRMAEHIAAC